MLLITHSHKGELEINYMWLPTWIGLNTILLDKLSKKLRDQSVGKVLTAELLEGLHESLLDLIVVDFPDIKGLREYLNSVRSVNLGAEDEH